MKRTKKNKMLYIKTFIQEYKGMALVYLILTIINILWIMFYNK